jgi:hypothetical protein
LVSFAANPHETDVPSQTPANATATQKRHNAMIPFLGVIVPTPNPEAESETRA